ncbi:hypothetical protein [Natrinema sp. SYSU A 869]|nr:hypothetical protein [Natrinema sp. SYSU A 869]
MAASDSSPETASSADDTAESAVGMAHPTVVPTNFNPEDSSDHDS